MNTCPNNSATSLMTIGSGSYNYLSLLKVIPLALLVTAGLVVFMERLIHMTEMVVDNKPTLSFPDPVLEEPKPLVNNIKELPKKPEPIEQAPTLPEPTEVEVEGPRIVIARESTTIKQDFNPGISFGGSMPVARYLVAAHYPSRALSRGIEGYVDVMFDVTAYGGTDNIQVLAAVPEGIFENSAIKAVAAWRFQPKTQDDKPVRFEGMKKRVRFEIQK